MDVVLDLFAEGVRQPGEPTHLHPHGEVLSLHKAGGDVGRVGIAKYRVFLDARTLRGAVPFLPLRVVAVDLDQLGVVDVKQSKGIGNSRQIHPVAVRGQLGSIRQATGNVLKELGSAPRIPPANKPANGELRLGLDGDEGPDIANDLPLGLLSGHVFLFAAHERPDFIDLDPLRRDVAEDGVLVLSASRPNFRQQPKDGGSCPKSVVADKRFCINEL